ncbi:Folate-biopterin transporter 1, chloroplastic, partial [Mucuna pruriens]
MAYVGLEPTTFACKAPNLSAQAKWAKLGLRKLQHSTDKVGQVRRGLVESTTSVKGTKPHTIQGALSHQILQEPRGALDEATSTREGDKDPTNPYDMNILTNHSNQRGHNPPRNSLVSCGAQAESESTSNISRYQVRRSKRHTLVKFCISNTQTLYIRLLKYIKPFFEKAVKVKGNYQMVDGWDDMLFLRTLCFKDLPYPLLVSDVTFKTSVSTPIKAGLVFADPPRFSKSSLMRFRSCQITTPLGRILKEPLQLDLDEIVVSFGFSALHGWSNLCMSLLVILSLSLKVISSVLSRLIGALSWNLMTTFVDNKYNVVFFFCITFLDVLWRGHAMSHKAPEYIFSGSSTFGRIVSSYFSGSLMDTHRVGTSTAAIIVKDIEVGGVATIMSVAFRITMVVDDLPIDEKKIIWKAQNEHYQVISYATTYKQLCSLTLLCSQTTLPQILFAMFYFTTNSLVLGRVKLATSTASLLDVGHYNGFMKNWTSSLVLSTFLLVHLHRMCGLSI